MKTTFQKKKSTILIMFLCLSVSGVSLLIISPTSSATYDRSYDQCVFSTYLGGNLRDETRYLTSDSAQNIYVTGIFESVGFATEDVFQRTQGGDLDAFVAKFSPLGELLFFTYIGGSRDDQADGIELDSEGNIIIFGQTESSDFPTSNAIYENKKGGFDLFITKLSPDGSSVLFSTYFGGSHDDFNHDGYHGSGLTVDHSDNIIFAATSESSDYPVSNEFQTDMEDTDVVLTKLSADGQIILFSI